MSLKRREGFHQKLNHLHATPLPPLHDLSTSSDVFASPKASTGNFVMKQTGSKNSETTVSVERALKKRQADPLQGAERAYIPSAEDKEFRAMSRFAARNDSERKLNEFRVPVV